MGGNRVKTATVSELRNNFPHVRQLSVDGGAVRITKRNRPFARLIPEPTNETFVNACPSPFPMPEDFDEPMTLVWEATK
jgi:prevent-host-death family protein